MNQFQSLPEHRGTAVIKTAYSVNGPRMQARLLGTCQATMNINEDLYAQFMSVEEKTFKLTPHSRPYSGPMFLLQYFILLLEFNDSMRLRLDGSLVAHIGQPEPSQIL